MEHCMAKAPNKTADTAKARVMADMPHYVLNNGDILQADEGTIVALAQAGKVDPHPDAVAYAESAGAAVKSLPEAD